MVRLLALVLAVVSLAACSRAPDTTAAAPAAKPAPAATNVLAGTPMATYGHALNKARNVQDVVNEQAKKQAKAVDDATGGGH